MEYAVAPKQIWQNRRVRIVTNLRGRVKKTQLPLTKGLVPLFETVQNSMHAIEETSRSTDGQITVKIIREGQATMNYELDAAKPGPNSLPDVTGFKIKDNGIGTYGSPTPFLDDRQSRMHCKAASVLFFATWPRCGGVIVAATGLPVALTCEMPIHDLASGLEFHGFDFGPVHLQGPDLSETNRYQLDQILTLDRCGPGANPHSQAEPRPYAPQFGVSQIHRDSKKEILNL